MLQSATLVGFVPAHRYCHSDSVILSGASAKRSEALAQSKDPYSQQSMRLVRKGRRNPGGAHFHPIHAEGIQACITCVRRVYLL